MQKIIIGLMFLLLFSLFAYFLISRNDSETLDQIAEKRNNYQTEYERQKRTAEMEIMKAERGNSGQAELVLENRTGVNGEFSFIEVPMHLERNAYTLKNGETKEVTVLTGSFILRVKLKDQDNFVTLDSEKFRLIDGGEAGIVVKRKRDYNRQNPLNEQFEFEYNGFMKMEYKSPKIGF